MDLADLETLREVLNLSGQKSNGNWTSCGPLSLESGCFNILGIDHFTLFYDFVFLELDPSDISQF